MLEILRNEEMARSLEIHIYLAQNLSSFPSTHVKRLHNDP